MELDEGKMIERGDARDVKKFSVLMVHCCTEGAKARGLAHLKKKRRRILSSGRVTHLGTIAWVAWRVEA